MPAEKKLFLVDAFALIFRAYYAFIRNPMYNAERFNTSCVFGFVNALEDLISRERPAHIAVAFDPSGPNFRHEIFPDYKANRDETPEDIKKSVPYIKDILKAYGIPIIQIDGYEADDVIGTLAKKAENDGYTVYMVTPDKDYIQLLSENIFIIKPGRNSGGFEVVDSTTACNDFQLKDPVQFIDILGLMGDAADNIPGAPGIGEKTAIKLISEFYSIENIFVNNDKLKGKVYDIILNNQEQIRLSKVLATIKTDVPLDINEESLVLNKPDLEEIKRIFSVLNFKTLEKRVLSRFNASSPDSSSVVQGTLFALPDPVADESVKTYSSIKDVTHNYLLVESDTDRHELIKNLSSLEIFCFDTETTSLHTYDAELVGMSFSWEDKKAYYIPFPHDQTLARKITEEFKSILENENISKVGQNIKYDILVLKNYGINVKGKIFDTMLAHYLLQPEQRHNMNYLSEKYLNYTPVHIEELIGEKGAGQSNMRNVSFAQIKEYAGEDADVTWQLYGILAKELVKEDLDAIAQTIEMPLVTVLADMEHTGVSLDTESLKDFAKDLRRDIIQLEEKIYSLAGLEFNISSPKQLGEILFERLKIEGNLKKTKTKQYATNEEVLVQLSGKHEIISLILEYRGLKKLLNTYVEALPKMIYPKSNKIHTSFSQAITSTGRLSSIDPNLQNIPIREERGREMRRAFIPSSAENIILSADYSQIELRIMAHLSNDENMLEAFKNKTDIHTATAAKIFGVKNEEVNREMRARAKTANFGIIYGISAFGLSQRLNISRKEAADLIDGYFKTFPGVKEYMESCIQLARRSGCVRTIFGRRRFLPDINSNNSTVRGFAERNAINSPIQGSAADIIKLAMINIHRRMIEKNTLSRMIIQVHDELVFDVYKPEQDWMSEMVKHEMENAVQLKVPLDVEVGSGNNWLEAH